MPFINDVVKSNQENLAKAKANSTPRLSRFLFKPENVIKNLSNQIIGQKQMIHAVGEVLQVIKADFGSESRPLSVMMFLGPTGVGKTETVKVLTESILGDADKLCRIDMNTLSQEHYAASITGAPPGYVGSKENTSLLKPEAIEGSFSRPGVVLFDEIEKASKNVERSLLSVLDDGRLDLTGGTKQINFRNSIIFMTSNIGASELSAYHKKFDTGWRSIFKWKPSKKMESAILKNALEKKFDPEFINRIDRIVCFDRLESSSVQDLVKLNVKRLNKRLRKHNATLQLSKSAEDFFKSHYDEQYGARDLERKIIAHLEPAFAFALNANPEIETFTAKCRKNKICISPKL